jgi:hypothetical protein
VCLNRLSHPRGQVHRALFVAEICVRCGNLGDPILDTTLCISAHCKPPVAKVQADLHPVLANAAPLTKDTQDSLDDLYPDIKASTESATVAITSAAHASEAVLGAAPRVAEFVVSIGKSADAVAADVKREADSVIAPKPWYSKILGPVYTVGKLVATFW